MANIKDPAFWRRFSVAVHLDNEASVHPTMAAPGGGKHTDNWLHRQQKKRRRNWCIFWIVFFFILALIAGLAVVIWWLLKNHMFPWQERHGNGKPSDAGTTSSSSSSSN